MKLFPTFLVVSFAAAEFLCVGADAPELSKLPPPAKTTGVTYVKDIRPIFETSCFRCHTGDRPKAALRLDSLDSVLKGSTEGRVIIPGESEHSALAWENTLYRGATVKHACYGALTRTRMKRCGAAPSGAFSRTTMVSVFVPVRLTSVVSGVLGTAPVEE